MSSTLMQNHIGYQIDSLDTYPIPLISTIKWSAENLPEGLSISADDGVISGTAKAEEGTYNVDITATNNWGSTTKTITITILPPEEEETTKDQTGE